MQYTNKDPEHHSPQGIADEQGKTAGSSRLSDQADGTREKSSPLRSRKVQTPRSVEITPWRPLGCKVAIGNAG